MIILRMLTRLLLPAMLLVACSSAPGRTDEGEPALPAQLVQVDMATFRLPLDDFIPSREQSQMLYNARNMLAVRCMQRFGYTMTMPVATDEVNTPGGRYERRYLLQSAARAEVYGYKWPEITNQKRLEEPKLDLIGESVLSGKGSNKVTGLDVPEGGCLGEAMRALGLEQIATGAPDLVTLIMKEDYQRTLADTRVKQATVRWSACMERAGYHYTNPGKANDDPVFATKVAGQAEILTATADVNCKQESNYIHVMAAVETAYQRRSIDRHQQRLRAVLVELEEEVKAASEVIAGRK